MVEIENYRITENYIYCFIRLFTLGYVRGRQKSWNKQNIVGYILYVSNQKLQELIRDKTI